MLMLLLLITHNSSFLIDVVWFLIIIIILLLSLAPYIGSLCAAGIFVSSITPSPVSLSDKMFAYNILHVCVTTVSGPSPNAKYLFSGITPTQDARKLKNLHGSRIKRKIFTRKKFKIPTWSVARRRGEGAVLSIK